MISKKLIRLLALLCLCTILLTACNTGSSSTADENTAPQMPSSDSATEEPSSPEESDPQIDLRWDYLNKDDTDSIIAAAQAKNMTIDEALSKYFISVYYDSLYDISCQELYELGLDSHALWISDSAWQVTDYTTEGNTLRIKTSLFVHDIIKSLPYVDHGNCYPYVADFHSAIAFSEEKTIEEVTADHYSFCAETSFYKPTGMTIFNAENGVKSFSLKINGTDYGIIELDNTTGAQLIDLYCPALSANAPVDIEITVLESHNNEVKDANSMRVFVGLDSNIDAMDAPIIEYSYYDVPKDIVTHYWEGYSGHSSEENNGWCAIPQINLPGEYVQQVNEEIRTAYDAESCTNGEGCTFLSIDYEWSVCQNIFSIVIHGVKRNANYDSVSHVYNIDLTTGDPLSPEDVYTAYGMTYIDYYEHCKDMLGCRFLDLFFGEETGTVTLDEDDVELYYSLTSNEVISSAIPYISYPSNLLLFVGDTEGSYFVGDFTTTYYYYYQILESGIEVGTTFEIPDTSSTDYTIDDYLPAINFSEIDPSDYTHLIEAAEKINMSPNDFCSRYVEPYYAVGDSAAGPCYEYETQDDCMTIRCGFMHEHTSNQIDYDLPLTKRIEKQFEFWVNPELFRPDYSPYRLTRGTIPMFTLEAITIDGSDCACTVQILVNGELQDTYEIDHEVLFLDRDGPIYQNRFAGSSPIVVELVLLEGSLPAENHVFVTISSNISGSR